MTDMRIRETEEAQPIMGAKVRDVMTPGPIGVDYWQSIGEAARAMRDWGSAPCSWSATGRSTAWSPTVTW